jgi:hypothetical protein
VCAGVFEEEANEKRANERDEEEEEKEKAVWENAVTTCAGTPRGWEMRRDTAKERS